MLIFRCEERPREHELIGTGAFRACLAADHDACASHNGDGKCVYDMPYPGTEPEGNPVHQYFSRGGSDHMRFGFDSIRSYRDAFNSPSGRECMDRNGGVLSVYEVDREHVLIGSAQVVFDHRKAKRVAILKCTDDYYAA